MRSVSGEPRVTVGIIVICAVLFLATGTFGVGSAGGNRLFGDLALFGPAIEANQEYWRLITSGFLHAGFLHIAFNMYLLWILGQMLEPTLGSTRFALLYFTSLLWGAFGALVVTPNALTVGASGAVFGLMGAAAVELRARGINPFQTQIGMLILLNLAISFIFSGISIGGHIGGLAGGVLVGVLYDHAERRRSRAMAYAGCAALMAVAVVGAILAANRSIA
ncbi:MAG: rhomboid family intramembrane serine protease [Solirubrobacteraceae bacterium]